MKSYSIVFFLCLSAGILATDDPATGNYIGKKPSDSWIATVSPKQNSDVQAAECSHNTRMSNQKFAWFKIDPAKVNQHQSTYGTCYATNQAPSESDLEVNSNYDVFFWQNTGGNSGPGTGPIRDPNTGEAGYEDNSGAFHTGKDPNGGSGSTSGGSSTTGTSGGSSTTGTSNGSSGVSNTGTTPSGSGTIPTSSGGKTPISHKTGHKHNPHSNDNTGSNPYGIWKLNRKRFSLI